MNKVTRLSRQDEVTVMIHRILDSRFLFLPTIEPLVIYGRIHDNADGEKGAIETMAYPDGGVSVSVDEDFSSLFFKMTQDGGRSPRVRNALLILAEAIRLDNKDSPGEAR